MMQAPGSCLRLILATHDLNSSSNCFFYLSTYVGHEPLDLPLTTSLPVILTKQLSTLSAVYSGSKPDVKECNIFALIADGHTSDVAEVGVFSNMFVYSKKHQSKQLINIRACYKKLR